MITYLKEDYPKLVERVDPTLVCESAKKKGHTDQSRTKTPRN